MNKADLIELIRNGEDSTLEFKQLGDAIAQYRVDDRVRRTACCDY